MQNHYRSGRLANEAYGTIATLPRTSLCGLFTSRSCASDAGPVYEQLLRLHKMTFVAPLDTRLINADADLHARLTAVFDGGLIYTLRVVRDERLLAEGEDVIIRRHGALLQQFIELP